MSAPENQLLQEDMTLVFEAAVEPSYISEIARRIRQVNDRWAEMSENTAIGRAIAVVAFAKENLDEQIETTSPFQNYEGTDGQKEGSPHSSVVEKYGDKEWAEYTVVTSNTNFDDIDNEDLKELVDPEVTIEDKFDDIDILSSDGNMMARLSERIVQDVMDRQFREYEETGGSGFNDPGVDFWVKDDDRRDWGLSIEISTRWVNPIGEKYIKAKKDKAIDKDFDLLIIAPRFRQNMLDKYEDPDDPNFNADPLSQMIHLHRVPTKEPEVYKPFAKSTEEISEEELNEPTGNPVIVSDSDSTVDRLSSVGHVGDDYPVVLSRFIDFREVLGRVNRDYRVVPESVYRNQVREALEPLLWEFYRPYRIEQFLIDMYWDRDLTQNEIGKLVDRSGSTIGTWMDSQHWDIITGTRSDELTVDTIETWVRMYEGIEPFPMEFSGYRIQAEWNRHPLWNLEDWIEWYDETTAEDRKEVLSLQDSYRENIDYTVLFSPETGLNPSYSFILSTIRGRNNDRVQDIIENIESETGIDIPRSENGGVLIRNPDEAPRVPYSAYPSRDTLKYMVNKDEDTIVETQ